MAKKKKATKKAAKKKASKKKAVKKATKKAAKKKTTAKKATKKKSTKKTTKKTTKKPTTKKTTKKSTSSSSGLKVGDAVSSLTLEATGGHQINLSQLKGQNVVVYFYPKDSTPGCTVEGSDFTRLHDQFKKQNTEVFGVSRDSMKSHENFKAKQNYSIELISDPEEKLCQSFGVIKEKNLYGRKFMGIERSTFVIDKNGKLVKEWRGVKGPGHAEEVLDFVKTL